MNVGQLIAELSKLPQDAEVKYLWDGYPRSRVSFVWEAKAGYVILADENDTFYSKMDTPVDRNSVKIERDEYHKSVEYRTPTLPK